jgi:prolyl-tRNA editing enzyme YbaK/EbsC (Cys-tRNA(Pro) deacylase)
VASVLDYLVERGTPFLALPDPGAASLDETAAANAISIDEVSRCELVISRMGPSLMVLPARRALDLDLVRAAVRDEAARRATEQEIRSLVPDVEPDALPPLARFVSAPMFVDPAVAAMDQIIFPAGGHTVLAVVQADELFRDEPTVIVPLTRESSVPGDRVAPARRTALERGAELPPVHLEDEDHEPEPEEDGDDEPNGNDAPGRGGRFMAGW